MLIKHPPGHGQSDHTYEAAEPPKGQGEQHRAPGQHACIPVHPPPPRSRKKCPAASRRYDCIRWCVASLWAAHLVQHALCPMRMPPPAESVNPKARCVLALRSINCTSPLRSPRRPSARGGAPTQPTVATEPPAESLGRTLARLHGKGSHTCFTFACKADVASLQASGMITLRDNRAEGTAAPQVGHTRPNPTRSTPDSRALRTVP